MRIRKAVIPVAGFGTRFLPASRSVPKVLLPVLDRPALHFAVEEAVEAGIEHLVVVVSRNQEAIMGYFDRMLELEAVLERQGKGELLAEMRALAEIADISYVFQKEPLGLGHAVLTARPVVGDEPFAVFLPDDIIWAQRPTIAEMSDLFAQRGGFVVAVKEVPPEDVPHLGIVDAEPLEDAVYRLRGMVEKPPLEEAPSNLAIIGRYILPPEVFDALAHVAPGALGEIQLTDALAALLKDGEAYAYRFPGFHLDVGTPLGLLKASIYEALQREGLGPELRRWLEGLL